MRNKILILLLLVLGFVVRLYKIDNPVADWHSWRQADTAAVTRNYVNQGIDLLRPRYDDFSDVSGKGLHNPNGYRFVEFPIYNLIHYSFYTLFGKFSLEIWGRLTTIICSLISAYLIYLIVKKNTQNDFIALVSLCSFLFIPFNIYYSRVILPDPLMVTLFLSAIYFSQSNLVTTLNNSIVKSGGVESYLAEGSTDKNLQPSGRGLFILTLIFSCLAVLVKPVAIFFLFPVFWNYRFSKKTWTIGLLSIGLFLIWRWWSYQFPEGVPASGWLLNGNKIRFRPAFFGWIFHQRLGELILGIWGLPIFFSGILQSFTTRYSWFIPWGVSSLIFLFTFATGNVQHDYYQIPIIPSISILLGIGTYYLWQYKENFFYTSLSRLLVIFSFSVMIYFGWFDVRGNGIKGYYQINHWEIVHAGQAADKLLPKDAKVAAPYMGDTAFLYQTNRKGFPVMAMPIKDLKDRFGIEYYISTSYNDETNSIINQYTVLERTPEYVIIKLDENPEYGKRLK